MCYANIGWVLINNLALLIANKIFSENTLLALKKTPNTWEKTQVSTSGQTGSWLLPEHNKSRRQARRFFLLAVPTSSCKRKWHCYFVEVQVGWKRLEANVVDEKPSPEHITHILIYPQKCQHLTSAFSLGVSQDLGLHMILCPWIIFKLEGSF